MTYQKSASIIINLHKASIAEACRSGNCKTRPGKLEE